MVKDNEARAVAIFHVVDDMEMRFIFSTDDIDHNGFVEPSHKTRTGAVFSFRKFLSDG